MTNNPVDAARILARRGAVAVLKYVNDHEPVKRDETVSELATCAPNDLIRRYHGDASRLPHYVNAVVEDLIMAGVIAEDDTAVSLTDLV